MSSVELGVRELSAEDIPSICSYWLDSEPDFLKGMGVDLAKLPSREQLRTMLEKVMLLPFEQKPSYPLIWVLNGQAIGHCNVTDIQFGNEAYMHLHMWRSETRNRGMGAELLKATLPYFFSNLNLKRVISEPYALNEAPSKTLLKAGFALEKEYTTIPGSLSFEQRVKRWVCERG